MPVRFKGLILIRLIGSIAEISGFSFAVTQSGYQVSAAIYDVETGRQYRTLISGKPYPIGTHSLEWDGRDRMGRIMPPGDYEWRVIQTPGFTARYVGSVGVNHNVPYDYWTGNISGPSGVVASATRMILSAGHEIVPSTACLDLDTYDVLWTYDYANGTYSSIQKGHIFDNRLIAYVSRQGARDIREVNLTTGIEIFRFTVPPYLSTQISSMATEGTVAAVGYGATGAIRFADLTTRLITAEILLSPSSTQILDLEYADGILHCLTTTGLWRRDGSSWVSAFSLAATNNPARIAWDPSRNEWLITEGPVDATTGHQVKRYSAAGALLNSYGRAGGRLGGAWVKEDFKSINVATPIPDGTGHFVVGEGGLAARRVVRLDLSGDAVKELYGPLEYYNFSSPDPGDPRRIIFNAGEECLGVALFNYETGDKEMVESYDIPVLSGLLPRFHQYQVRCWPMRKGGDLYIVSDLETQVGILKVDLVSGRLIPWATRGAYSSSVPILLEARNANWGGGGDPTSFIWLNESQTDTPQVEDIILSSDASRMGSAHWLDNDWNIVSRSGIYNEDNIEGWVETPNTDPNADFPDWGASSNMAVTPEEIRGIGYYETRAVRRHQGSTYLLLAANRNINEEGDYHGQRWPSLRVGSSRIIKWGSSGEIEWVIGQGAMAEPPPPGFHTYLSSAQGFIQGNIVVGDWFANPGTAYTEDGLYAGYLLQHRADDGLPDWVYVWRRGPDQSDSPIPADNLMGGSIWEHDGHVYWSHMGNQYTPLYEITGWDDWVRQEGLVQNLERVGRTGDKGLNGLAYPSFDLTGTGVEILSHRLFLTTGTNADRADRINWTDGPAPGIPLNQPFSVRWTGSLEIPFTGAWAFGVYNVRARNSGVTPPEWLTSLGVARVWVDGSAVVDTELGILTSRDLHLEAGSLHTLEVELQHIGAADAYFTLNWESSEQERQRIPSQWLYQAFDDSTKPVLSIALAGTLVTVSSSVAPSEPLDVLLTMFSTQAIPPNLPKVRIPADTLSVQFALDVSTGEFAEVEVFLNPTEGYDLDPASSSVRYLASATPAIFPFTSGEIIVLAEQLNDPTKVINQRIPNWNHVTRQSAQFLEGGGVTASVSTDEWLVEFLLPTKIDLLKNRIVYYMRGRTFGTGSGRLRVGGSIAVRMSPRTTTNPATTVGARGRTTATSDAKFNCGNLPTSFRQRQIDGEALDFRVEFFRSGLSVGATGSYKFAVDADWIPGITVDPVVVNGNPLLIPSPMGSLVITNDGSPPTSLPAGIVDAVAMSIIPYG